jgi:hypothetical protein
MGGAVSDCTARRWTCWFAFGCLVTASAADLVGGQCFAKEVHSASPSSRGDGGGTGVARLSGPRDFYIFVDRCIPNDSNAPRNFDNKQNFTSARVNFVVVPPEDADNYFGGVPSGGIPLALVPVLRLNGALLPMHPFVGAQRGSPEPGQYDASSTYWFPRCKAETQLYSGEFLNVRTPPPAMLSFQPDLTVKYHGDTLNVGPNWLLLSEEREVPVSKLESPFSGLGAHYGYPASAILAYALQQPNGDQITSEFLCNVLSCNGAGVEAQLSFAFVKGRARVYSVVDPQIAAPAPTPRDQTGNAPSMQGTNESVPSPEVFSGKANVRVDVKLPKALLSNTEYINEIMPFDTVPSICQSRGGNLYNPVKGQLELVCARMPGRIVIQLPNKTPAAIDIDEDGVGFVQDKDIYSEKSVDLSAFIRSQKKRLGTNVIAALENKPIPLANLVRGADPNCQIQISFKPDDLLQESGVVRAQPAPGYSCPAPKVALDRPAETLPLIERAIGCRDDRLEGDSCVLAGSQAIEIGFVRKAWSPQRYPVNDGLVLLPLWDSLKLSEPQNLKIAKVPEGTNTTQPVQYVSDSLQFCFSENDCCPKPISLANIDEGTNLSPKAAGCGNRNLTQLRELRLNLKLKDPEANFAYVPQTTIPIELANYPGAIDDLRLTRVYAKLPAHIEVSRDSEGDPLPLLKGRIFDSVEDCQRAKTTGGRPIFSVEGDTPQATLAQAVVLTFNGNIASECTLPKPDPGRRGLVFKPALTLYVGKRTIIVASLGKRFRTDNIDYPLRGALREWLNSLAEAGKQNGLILASIGSDKVVDLSLLRGEQFPELQHAERRSAQISEIVKRLDFNSEGQQPVADAYYIDASVKNEYNVERIVYIVDSNTADFSPRDVGTIFDWLLSRKFRVSIVSLGPCDGWNNKFSAASKSFSCFELPNVTSNPSAVQSSIRSILDGLNPL